MISFGIAFPVAIITVAVCAARGQVARGLLAGLLVFLLGLGGLVVDFVAAVMDPSGALALLSMFTWPTLMIVVMAVAISKRVAPVLRRVRPKKKRARSRRDSEPDDDGEDA